MQLSAYAGALVLTGVAVLGAGMPGVRALWDRYKELLLAMSAGLLAATGAFHLLPAAAPLGERMGPAFLSGFFGVLVLEALLHRLVPHHEGPGPDLGGGGVLGHMSISAVVGFSLHGLVDGVALYTSAQAQHAPVTTAALLAHHLPLAVSVAALLRGAGKPLAFWPMMLVGAAMPVVGVFLAGNVLVSGTPVEWLSAAAAGVFIYVACHNLLPVMDLEPDSIPQILAVFVGAALVWAGHALGE